MWQSSPVIGSIREDVEAVAKGIVHLNPHTTVEKLMQHVEFDESGALIEW